MSTAILSALPEEQAGLVQALAQPQRIIHAGRSFWRGELYDRPVVLALSGMGKVAAATTATALIERFGAARILFTGVAGGVGDGVRVGDVVVASDYLQHDMDASPLFPRWELPGYGAAAVRSEGCTLCLACTMVCPTGAFRANPDRPELSFLEDACVQCGLCVATCPEKVISLEPRLNFAEAASQPRVVKAEEPAACTRCGKLFGTRASVARVKEKLRASGHWMFSSPERLAVLDLCEDCRAIEATTGGLDPYAGPERPATTTTEDYLRRP